ncbi:MAG: BON domain-containing protein [Planctomycetota bacterium]|nr:MAG: BON domain-containing protein [Planctomycetota bacterium]REK27796.1 MAG: BON domain-containing protein [Planctomycetota bacterium]REK34422.1 MAG: BON domain-containing protein [Planctomycetota bacterium]
MSEQLTGQVQDKDPGATVDSAVREALRRSSYRDLHNLEVVRTDGRVCVAGRVPTYYLKQKAQTIAMSVMSNQELQNEVVVR